MDNSAQGLGSAEAWKVIGNGLSTGRVSGYCFAGSGVYVFLEHITYQVWTPTIAGACATLFGLIWAKAAHEAAQTLKQIRNSGLGLAVEASAGNLVADSGQTVALRQHTP